MNRHHRRAVARSSSSASPGLSQIHAAPPASPLGLQKGMRYQGRTLRIRLFVNTDEADAKAWIARTWSAVAGPRMDMGFTVVSVHEPSPQQMSLWQEVQRADTGAAKPVLHGGRALEIIYFLNTDEAQSDVAIRVQRAALGKDGVGPLMALFIDEVPLAASHALWSKVRESLWSASG